MPQSRFARVVPCHATCCFGLTVEGHLIHSPTPRRPMRPNHPNLFLLGFRTYTQLGPSWSTTPHISRAKLLVSEMFGEKPWQDCKALVLKSDSDFLQGLEVIWTPEEAFWSP